MLNSSPHVPEELDVKTSISLAHIDSFDQYEKPILKESFKTEISLIKNFSKSYKLPFNPACYGFSQMSFSYTDHFALNFLPLEIIPDHLCTPLYSRAFMVEFQKNLKTKLNDKNLLKNIKEEL